MKILEVEKLNVFIDKSHILEDISFEVKRGEVMAVIGPNGAGKTILFKALLGLLPHTGEIKWAKDIKIGYVPQRIDIDIDIPLTVEEFLKLRAKDATKKRIKEVLKSIELDEKILKSGLGEISVGQRQRLLIAWSILDYPDVLLFDEPTADVDISGQESIYKTVSLLRQKMNLTLIVISHDLNVVYQYAQKILCLNHRNLCFGRPEEALKTEQLQKLYGGERSFYTHHHETKDFNK